MSAQGELFKAEGMRRADAAADEAWKARVDSAIEALAGQGLEFTSETVRIIAGDPPNHPNAFGSRFNAAARRGIIRQVGYRKADRPSLHRHPLAVWVGA